MAAKFRSFLTILGVIIGVAAVIIIFAVGRSAQELILDQIRGIGSNLVAVMPGASNENGPPAAAMGITITSLKYDDLEEIRKRKNIPQLESAAGYVSGTSIVKYREEEMAVSFTGATASYIEVEDAEVYKGRFFSKEEEKNFSRVAVLGFQVARDLFGDSNPIGRKIKLSDYKFTIVGVLEERGSAAFGVSSQNDSVFIPLFTAQKLILGINHLAYIRAKVDTVENIPLAKNNIKNILRNQHDIDNPEDDDFSVRDQASAVEVIGNVTDALRYFLLAVGTISLIVGGVGIMNVMLIAVNQRIKEVGLRKAVGARDRDVMIQFLIESAFISFLGGSIGIIFGVATSFLISVIVKSIGYDWQFLISIESILVAVSVSIFIGLVFGIYPARKASQISPMEALRYE